MDKSVAQKFMIVMSVFVAAFATVFVCGNVINGGISSDGYRRPIPKTNIEVSYTDRSVEDNIVGTGSVSSSDASPEPVTRMEGNVKIIEFIDDEEEGQNTTVTASTTYGDYDVDEQFLYMTTVTTTGTAFRKTTTRANAVAVGSTTKASSRKSTSARTTWTAAATRSTAVTTFETSVHTTTTTFRTTPSRPASSATVTSQTKATSAVTAITGVSTVTTTAATSQSHDIDVAVSVNKTNANKSSDVRNTTASHAKTTESSAKTTARTTVDTADNSTTQGEAPVAVG